MENKDEKQRFCTSTKCSAILGVIILVAIAIVCVVTFVDKDLRQKVQYDSGDLEWWKTTIVYQIYPRSFQDSDGDGTGDLRGIISRLGHFTYLNIGAIWISPFYESPMRDFGYDVKNFTKIDPMFGTMKDFEELIKEANKRGIKIIMDFVPNHSSNDSMWFKKSRNMVDPYTDYYIWSDGKPVSHNTSVPPFNREPPNNWKAVFGGSAWSWDDVRHQYYYHAFLDSQPDLNYRNKNLKKEIMDAMRFWLNKGVAGFRLDALKFMYETTNTSLNDPDFENFVLYNDLQPHIYTTNSPEIYGVLREWRQMMNEIEKEDKLNRFMIAESYGLTSHMRDEYYKAGSVPFNFALISRLNKTCGGECIKDIVHDSVVGLPDNAWPNFVMGNHDNHRISDRLGMDMVNAFNMLLLTLPGTPTTYYGEEIGMEDTEYIYKELKDPYGINNKDHFKEVGRDPERSPMQWNSSGNAGFTIGKPWLRINANYQTLNVEIQKTSKKVTTLQVYKKLAELRQTPSFQNSDIKFGPTDENVFSYVRSALGRPKYFIIINFGQSKTTGDYSMDPVGSSKGDVVISATDSVNDLYRVGDIIDLTSITLERGQGLVILVK